MSSVKTDPVLRSKIEQWRAKSPLRRWRESQQMFIWEAAAKCGVSPTSFHRWELGYDLPTNYVHKESKRLVGIVHLLRGQKERARARGIRKDWDDHMMPITGVSIAALINWHNTRP